MGCRVNRQKEIVINELKRTCRLEYPFNEFFFYIQIKPMAKFESSIKTIASSQEKVYDFLSDLTHIEAFKEQIPDHLVKDLSFDADSITLSVAPIGKVTFNIIEREPHKCIKFKASNSPVPLDLWIQIVAIEENSCKTKLTAGVEVNPFMKGMIQKPISDGLEKMVELIANLPY